MVGSVGRSAASHARTLQTDGRWQHLLRSWSADRGRYRLPVCVHAHRLVAYISQRLMELAGSLRLQVVKDPNLP